MNDLQTLAASSKQTVSSEPIFYPSLRYVDAPRAIEWLVTAFGFTKQAVYPGENGTVAHAQLTFGSGVILLGSSTNGGSWAAQSPQELDGAATGGVYVLLDRDEEIDRHCARARAAGAQIIAEPEDADYGGRGYSARDPEGHYWSFGTYRPAAEHP